ncbi:MAG TPA: ATP-binding protein [Verrucomicrobiae bacterium]|jgi:signal transduction histidine kinase/CheY-like chemotaxis protein|nr:ATP-binding protein [Verrucomicrobiae bacterium]
MNLSSLNARVSFQVKVLVPVIAVMVLLTSATIWLVNLRISAQFEEQAAAQLDKDHSIFTKLQANRIGNLLSKYRGISSDSRYRAFIQSAEDSQAWYNTTSPFLSSQVSENGATVATCTVSPDSSHGFASASLEPMLDLRQFQIRSGNAVGRAFGGQPATDTISVGPQIFNIVSVPVLGMEEQTGVVTFGVEIGQEVAQEMKQLKDSEILLLADGRVVASSLTQTSLYPELISRFNELSSLAASAKRTVTIKLVLDKKHYIAEAGRLDSFDGSTAAGYLMLSSYEESWAVLKATQQMLLAIGLLGIGLSTLIICVLIHKVTQPLRQLRDSAEAVGRGDYSKRVEVESRDEYGELATAFNRMTENIQTSNQELEKTVATLKSTQDQLIQSEKLSGIGEFVAGVAHELNNPLTSVMGFSELLQQGEMPEQQRRYLDMIFKSAKRCQKIVQSLLSFARRHAPERKVVCVNQIVESAVEILQYQMRTSNIEVFTQLDSHLPASEVDSHQMQQVFLNIINNARQAIEAQQTKGWLRVTTESAEGRVRVIFQDNGPGIAPENLKRIFNPFFTTKEVGKGTGLGLSLCYGIVSEHGGSITPHSEPGNGATFVIELPVANEVPTVAPKIVAPASAETAQEGVGKRVLVVDDEDAILQMIREALTRSGYRVDIAHDGESALRRLGQYHYDLALCDWKMPGLNGQQVYERLQESNPEMSRRLIFITGDMVNKNTQEFLQSRDKICLTKPFTLVEFRSAISRVLTAN